MAVEVIMRITSQSSNLFLAASPLPYKVNIVIDLKGISYGKATEVSSLRLL